MDGCNLANQWLLRKETERSGKKGKKGESKKEPRKG
jgi:hypothetical protein